jgi:hypothetical protein
VHWSERTPSIGLLASSRLTLKFWLLLDLSSPTSGSIQHSRDDDPEEIHTPPFLSIRCQPHNTREGGGKESVRVCFHSLFFFALVSSFSLIVQPAVSIMSSSSFVVTAIVTMIGLWGVWNSDASVAAAAGTGSYRIRSRPPPGTTHQQPSRSSSTGMSRSSNTNNNNNWQDVYIAGFLALSDHEIEAPLGQGVMPAITLALRHLANSSFLHDYRLRLLYNDTQVLHHPVCFLRPSFSLVSHLSHDDDADGT